MINDKFRFRKAVITQNCTLFLQEFQRALSSKQPVYNAVVKSGVSLHEKAAISCDKDEIERVLNELKDNWKALKQKSQQR